MTYAARIPGILAALSLLLAVAGCSFDDDTDYLPRTQGVFLLINAPSGNRGEVICIRDSSIDYNQALEPQQISCMAGTGRKLWLGDDQAQQLYLYDCADMSVVRSFSLPDSVVPTSLVAQNDLVFCADSIHRTVLAFNDRGNLRARRTLPATARVLAVNSGFVLAASGAHTVYWLNVNDLSIRDSVVCTHTVERACWFPPESFMVCSRDSAGTLYQTGVSYQGRLGVLEQKQEGAIFIECSPYRTQAFGTEYLGTVYIFPNSVSAFFGQLTGQYAVTDFFSPALYGFVSTGDTWSLVRQKASGADTLALRNGVRPQIRASHVYVDGDAAYGQP